MASEPVVGFVGVGAMGVPMIQQLAAGGVSVLAYDVDTERLQQITTLPRVRAASDLREVAGCTLIVCMLPSNAAVADVVAGPHGVLRTLRPGSLIVDMGSSDPAQTVRLAEAAAAAGSGLVDAPVSGGVARARTGTLTVMFGGTAAELGRCRWLLDVVGGSVVHVGGVGAGHAMKALNNLLSAVGLAAATEVMEIGERFGLDPRLMLDVLNQSTGQNSATSTKYAQFVLSGTFASGFRMQLMLKDMRTAVDLGRRERVSMTLAEAALGAWEEAAASLPPDADQTELARRTHVPPPDAGD